MTIQERFEIYHNANPLVYDLFVKYTMQVIARGYARFSSKAVFERLRWYFAFETKGDNHKINNNYTALYSRMFMEQYPQYKGFFETRERKNNEN